MDVLDAVLPIFVDYLGSFEEEKGQIEKPSDVMKHLLDHGVQEQKFLPNGELVVSTGQIVLKDTMERVNYECQM